MAEPIDLTTIADAAPASDDLLRHMLETWQEYRAEVPDEAPIGFGQNIAQLNRVAWMGERMGHVLAEIGRLWTRVAELEREQARIDAAFEKASTIAESDHPDVIRRAWELIAGALAGPGAPAQPATGGEADG